MVLYQDIARSVTIIIKEAFPNAIVYGDEVREGYKKPSFFIGIMPVSSINHTKSIKEEQLMITISYFSDTTESLKNYQVMQQLNVAIGQVLCVDNRRLTIQEMTTEKVGEDGDIYQITFDIDYFELANDEPRGEIVREIIYN